MKHMKSWGIGLVAIILIGVFTVMPATNRIHPDFIAYYQTGRMVIQGETTSRIYEYPWYQRQTVYAGIDDVPSGIGYNPPTATLSLLPLGWLEPKQASFAWLGVNVAAAIALLAVLARATGLPFLAGLVLLLGSTVAFRNNLVFGQIYLVLTFLVATALALWDAGRRGLAGALLGAITAVKLFTAPFLLYFLWRRDWRAVIGFMMAVALVFTTSLLLLGWDLHSYWATAVLPRVQQGFGDDPARIMETWNSLLLQLFYYNESWNPDPPIRSIFAFWLIRDLGTLSLLACAFYAARTRDNALGLSIVLLVLPLISPSTRSYHLILYLVPLAYWGMYLVKQGRWPIVIAMTFLYFLAASRLSSYSPIPFLKFGAPLLLAVLILWESRPWRLPTWVIPSILSIALVHAIVASKPRNYDAAVSVTPGVSLVTSPTYRDGALAYSALSCEKCSGYTLLGNIPEDLQITGHIFGTRFPRETSTLFFEQAEHGHSKILEWHNNTLHRWSPANISYMSPSPSLDGLSLVAICNGDLHFFSAPGQGYAILSLDGEIADPDLSPDGSHVAFAWYRNGQWGIYQTDLDGRDPIPLTTNSHRDRWPRYSPNGAWVAFSRYYPTADIWVIELETGRELRITQDAGNDTEPVWSDDGKTLFFVSDRNRAIHQGSIYRIALPDDITKSTSMTP